jgi:photosystem II stability/assembly factor-like uncharacterized protein
MLYKRALCRFMLFTAQQPNMRRLCYALALLLACQSYAQIKPTPAAERLKGLQNRKQLEQRSLLKDVSFRNVGPTVMSGRVVDVDVNPTDPTEFYVAYASGGLWQTRNNGQSFTPIFDSADVITIGDIAVNWNANPRVIWVGTGEVNSSRSSYAGTGMYRSINNGKSWDYIGLPESHHIGKIQLHPGDVNTAWVAVLGHLYSPNKERGIYKTSDAGKTWKQTLFNTENTGAIDIDINPSNPSELYAATWYRTRSAWNFEEGGATSGIYKSTDAGDTWQLVSTPTSGFLTGAGTGRIGIAVYPKDPKVVYAVVDNQNNSTDTTAKKPDSNYVRSFFKDMTVEAFNALDTAKLTRFLRRSRFPAKYTATSVKALVNQQKIKPAALYDYLDVNDGFQNTPIGCEVYRSDDAGKTWKKTNTKPLTIYSTYGYYFGKIYVSPYNDQKVYLTGYTSQISIDGGKTFKTMDKPNVHADHHALWVDPKRDAHLINGNDGGLNITYDDGEHWIKANSPAVGQFYNIAVDDDKPYNIYGGLQDNGTWVGPSINKESPSWQQSGHYAYKSVGGGDGMQVQVDTRDNNTMYTGFQFGNYTRSKRNAPVGDDDDVAEASERNELQSNDDEPAPDAAVAAADPNKPLFIHPQHELGEQPLRFNWQTPILLSSHNQDVLYYGSNRFHRSMFKGENMEVLSVDLSNGKKTGDVPFGTMTTLSESPLRFGLLYAGTDDGNVQLSKDGGYTWTLLGKGNKKTPGLPSGLYVSRVVASAYKEGRVYVTLNGYRDDHFAPYAFVSEDYGTTWKQIGKDLPQEPVNVIKEDPVSDSIIYVGTDGGLYVSINGGSDFMMWNAGLPKSVPVHDIAIQKRENEIVLGTHGRSLYVAKLDTVQKLLRDKGFYDKRKAEADKFVSFLSGNDNVYAREGLNVNCPPLKSKKRVKETMVVVTR